ncbi:adenosylcobinamide-GDP ribazoletransferase [bacterium]|nr:adenosylcobinamide-GDP ribazoletransferase [bacterium]
MKFFKGLSSAVRTLSILPCWEEDFPSMGLVLSWAPWVGFLLSGICTGLVMPAHLLVYSWQDVTNNIFFSFLMAALYLVLMSILTRGFHLDGLADTCDGFGGGWEKERVLEIMRDSSIGSFGAIALICVFLVKFVSLAILIYHSFWSILWIVPSFSRLLIVWQASSHKYARDVDSLAGNVITSTQRSHFYRALFHFVIVLLPFVILPYLLVKEIYFLTVIAIVLLAGWICCRFIGCISERKIGGLTGDVLGAMVESSEGIMFMVAAGISLMLLK